MAAASHAHTEPSLSESVGDSEGRKLADDSLDPVDPEFPGTAVLRLRSIHARIAALSEADLSGDWRDVRRKLLWAGGLKDLPHARPGEGYTGHSFNDDNHCDLAVPRLDPDVADSLHDGSVSGIALGNFLGKGIRVASIQPGDPESVLARDSLGPDELPVAAADLPPIGPGGSWSTCMMGCDTGRDVAHLQFRSRIAFKLVWAPNDGKFDRFVLVDDDGNLLAVGSPKGSLPSLMMRQSNYLLAAGRRPGGSKYSVQADKVTNDTPVGPVAE